MTQDASTTLRHQSSLARFPILWAMYAVTLVLFLVGVAQRPDAAAVTDNLAVLHLIAFALVVPSLFKYYVQLAVAPWSDFFSWRKAIAGRTLPRYEPAVSVIIPAWNEQVGILNTVRSVLASTYSNLEVIVVNDGSTDDTDGVMRRFVRQHKSSLDAASLRYLVQPNGGKATALNRGIAHATGEIIITIDADSVVAKDAVAKFVARFQDPRVMAVAGNVRIGNQSQVIGLLQQLEYVFGFYFKRADALLNSIYIVGGAAAAYRRTVFTRVGYFDETIITEDIEMSTRIQDAGLKIDYAPDAIVFTEGPTDVASLCKQRLRWKFGRLVTFRKYRHLFFSRDPRHSRPLTHFVLPLAVLGEVLLFLELPILTIFLGYAWHTRDFRPLLASIITTAVVVVLQVVTERKSGLSLKMLALAPIAWLVFYLVDVVEFQALLRSLWRLARNRQVTWQRWTRVGVFDDTTGATPALTQGNRTTGTGDTRTIRVAVEPRNTRETGESLLEPRISTSTSSQPGSSTASSQLRPQPTAPSMSTYR